MRISDRARSNARAWLLSTSFLCVATANPFSALAQSSEPVDLSEIVVEGQAAEETTAGPVEGYRALTADGATGTRTPLEQIPQSIVVIPRSVIEDQASPNVGAALRNVAGVQTNNPASTPAFDSTLLRGFQAEFLDDGFTLYQYNPGDRESLVNIERIEVLKGPTALLYSGGSGSPVGGVINLVPKKPESEAFGQIEFRTGGHALYQPSFDLNQPFSDNVRVRVTGEYTSSESHIDVLETDRFNLNPSILLTDNDGVELLVQGRHSSWRQQEYQGLPATGAVAGDRFIRDDLFIGPKDVPRSYSETSSVTGALTHQVDEALEFKLRLRYSTTEFEENVQTIVGADFFTADTPAVAPSTWWLSNGELYQEQEELSGSATATLSLDLLGAETTLLLGADASKLDDAGFIDVGPFFGTVDLADPSFPTAYGDPGAGVANSFVENRTAGLFAQAQATVADRVHLLGGLRLGHVSVETNGQTAERTRLLPRLGAVVDLTEGLGLFASYSQGLRGQPFASFVDKAEPVEIASLEGGLKLNLAGGLSGAATIYQIERSNVAVTDALFNTRAEGEELSRGVELDLLWTPTPAFSLIGAYAYTDAEYSKTTGSTVDGHRLPGVPLHSGRLWASYRFQDPTLDGLRLGAGVYAQSAEKLSANNVYEADAFYTVDASLNYDFDAFGVTLGARNLTDQEYFERYSYFGGRVAPADGVNGFVSFRARY